MNTAGKETEMKKYNWTIDGGKTPSQIMTTDEADCIASSVGSIYREVDMGYAIARITPNSAVTFSRFGEHITAEALFDEKGWHEHESVHAMISSLR